MPQERRRGDRASLLPRRPPRIDRPLTQNRPAIDRAAAASRASRTPQPRSIMPPRRLKGAVAGALAVTALATPAAGARPVEAIPSTARPTPPAAGPSQADAPAPTVIRTHRPRLRLGLGRHRGRRRRRDRPARRRRRLGRLARRRSPHPLIRYRFKGGCHEASTSYRSGGPGDRAVRSARHRRSPAQRPRTRRDLARARRRPHRRRIAGRGMGTGAQRQQRRLPGNLHDARARRAARARRRRRNREVQGHTTTRDCTSASAPSAATSRTGWRPNESNSRAPGPSARSP